MRLLGPDEADVLRRVTTGVFDHPVVTSLAAEFVADPRHHVAVAIDEGRVVGMASGVHYIHPDKPAELWINEVGVAPMHRRRGLARRLLACLLERGAELGCAEAWVLTEGDNAPARSLYASLGGREEPTPAYYTFALDRGPATD